MVAAASRPEPPLACLFRRPGCEPKPVRFLRFPLKVRGSGVWGDRETVPHGCSSISSGAATGLPFSPLRVRTKTCPFFAFSVASGLRLFVFPRADLKQKADTRPVYHVGSSEIRVYCH